MGAISIRRSTRHALSAMEITECQEVNEKFEKTCSAIRPTEEVPWCKRLVMILLKFGQVSKADV